eukprot:TRINITY_DN3253_c0_g3_i3.p2 TRINITY_DN3253_c0_g3~~TRINITY_DN3253_c0_g3_i3.p2  ORF type:complete len:107 (+),score=20.65 TRINITY_DN3253_c0_g3_i3:18-338(+)
MDPEKDEGHDEAYDPGKKASIKELMSKEQDKEVRRLVEQIFKRADLNGDKVLEFKEFKEYFATKEGADTFHALQSFDGDGWLKIFTTPALCAKVAVLLKTRKTPST